MREGSAVLSCGMECLSPNETFRGSENSLVMKIHYQVVFDCSFPNIHKYPFDREECSFTFYVSGQNNKLTTLVPKAINISSPSSVSQYQVLKWQINETLLQNGQTGIKVNISVKTAKLQIFHLYRCQTMTFGDSEAGQEHVEHPAGRLPAHPPHQHDQPGHFIPFKTILFLSTLLINMINQEY